MAQAWDIVQALVERAPPRPPVERTTGMPYGWALWLRGLKPLPAGPHAGPREVATVLAERPVLPAPRGEELTRWPAFFSLFREGWSPAPRDQRPLRWLSRVGTLVLHLLFLAFLAWIAWMQSMHVPVPPEADGGGERVAIGFVGAGDPGTPQSEADSAATAGAPQSDPSLPAAQATAAPADASVSPPPPGEIVAASLAPPPPALPEMAVREVPEPIEAPAPAEQPVQVTEVAQPSIDYVLPPTTPRAVEMRRPAEQPLREREVAVVVAPQVRAPRPQDIVVDRLREVEVALRSREVEEPLPEVRVRPMPVRAPQVDATLSGVPESSVRQREVAMPAMSSTGTAAAPVSADATSAPAAAAPAPGMAAVGDGGQGRAAGRTGTTATGSSSALPAPAGGAPSPLRGDDWGQSPNGEPGPGAAQGLFDGQGRVRLPGEGSGTGHSAGPGSGPGAPGDGVAERGAPGGDSDSWSRERFEQSGTWLKRPPYDYEPTSFDRYWVPNESLLAEWVRKGMKTVAIPIPGTGKKINCVVSLLQLGGGCGIVDPNLDLQPAQARPPPDIPFKPELQEDNGSLPPNLE